MKKKILFVIPARKNSKRIKNKNLLPFHGKPLVLHSIQTAKQSKFSGKIIVTTDSKAIGKLAEKARVEYIKRPAKFAGDLSPDIDWLRHALAVLKRQNYVPDYIVHLRPTTPLRDAKLVDKIIKKLLASPGADAIRTVEQAKFQVEKCVYIADNGLMKDYFNNRLRNINLASQNFRRSYSANGYVDAFKNRYFSKKTDIYQGLKVIPYVMPQGSVLDIDTLMDLENYGR